MSIAAATVRAKLTQSQKKAIIDHYYQDPKLSLVRVGQLYGYNYNQMNYLFYKDKFGKQYNQAVRQSQLNAGIAKPRIRVKQKKLSPMEKLAKNCAFERMTRTSAYGRIIYSDELKEQCCEAILRCGHITLVSENTGIAPATLYKWFKCICGDVYEQYVLKKREYDPQVSNNTELIEKAIRAKEEDGIHYYKTAIEEGIRPATLYHAIAMYRRRKIIFNDGVAEGIESYKKKIRTILGRTDIDDPASIRGAISEILE